jgi:hypothetical protein
MSMHNLKVCTGILDVHFVHAVLELYYRVRGHGQGLVAHEALMCLPRGVGRVACSSVSTGQRSSPAIWIAVALAALRLAVEEPVQQDEAAAPGLDNLARKLRLRRRSNEPSFESAGSAARTAAANLKVGVEESGRVASAVAEAAKSSSPVSGTPGLHGRWIPSGERLCARKSA